MTEQELAGTIWNIKEIIRGVYDDTEVENVILPFTLLRRLDCVLQDAWRDPAKDKVGCEFPFTRLFYRYTPLRSIWR
ncbi:MAG: type I restriction-modification system subunit M N-terminal domain-containing protein [Muribaculaceae bacterium]